MESSRSKRERGKNYTEREKQYVLEIARNYIDIIDAKQTDAGTNKRKNDAWDKIAEEFNPFAENGPRTGVQMKTLYHSMKKLVRRNLLNGNKDYVSVGDPLENNELSENETYDNVRSFTPKVETDEDSCFEVGENLAGASDENSCSLSNFNAEIINNGVIGQNNFSTPIADKESNEFNFNVQKVQLNFNNVSDISQSSTARDNINVHKRERGRNYSEMERMKFLNIIAQYADIIESKETDMKTMKRKNEAWDRIVMEYNTATRTGTGNRTKDQLKHLYFGFKKTNKNFLKSTNQSDSEQSFQNIQATSTPLQPNENDYNYDYGIHRNFENIGNNPPDSRTNFDKTSTNHQDHSGTVGVKTEQASFTEAEPPSPENTIEQEQQTQILPQQNQTNNEQDEEEVHQEQQMVVQQLQELPVPEPSTKRKKPNNSEKSYREQVEKIKYEMLLVRKEKEEIERDILLLDLRKKELEIKEKEYQLRNMNLI